MEAAVARDSGATIVARRSGVVDQIDGARIVVNATEETDTSETGVDIYNLLKFQRSNQNTCLQPASAGARSVTSSLTGRHHR